MGTKTSGFASMTPERRREVASKGGRKSQRNGTAHRFRTSEEAARCGRMGGTVRTLGGLAKRSES